VGGASNGPRSRGRRAIARLGHQSLGVGGAASGAPRTSKLSLRLGEPLRDPHRGPPFSPPYPRFALPGRLNRSMLIDLSKINSMPGVVNQIGVPPR
jgi:hypothetical protein